MAGIFDEVMDGISAKEKQTPPAAPGTVPPAAPTPAAGEQTPPPATPPNGEDKGLHDYSSAFKEKYGERKKPA